METVTNAYNVKAVLSTAPASGAYLAWDAHEPVFLQADQEPGPRGLGLRIFGVDGPRLPSADQSATTQDFFFNNAPMIELTDVNTCLDIMQLREKYFDSPLKSGAATKLRTDAMKQAAPFQLPNTNMISHSFYTQSAFRFGTWYGHIGLFPVLDEMTSRNDKVQNSDSREQLRDWMVDYFRSHGAKYEIKVRSQTLPISKLDTDSPAPQIQLGTDAHHHPTEDGSVMWDEATAPYQTIAFLEFPPQDALTSERRTFWEDRMKLSPWHALVEHQPLGSINRLRRTVYEMSAKNREGINAVQLQRVNSVDEIP
ncbi:hypothetical protein OPT61_g8093 [Boeremia exigua]|uniref:Uncharacterized protein n=1 Tax=Boeremia exigua TaxID=749465 RepID=A0ACC2I0P9_9PLEO|nr:hypothetical protein OPT61_g8093 [Boeremia exigua]